MSKLPGSVPRGPRRCNCCDHLMLVEVNGVFVCHACDLVNEWPKQGWVA